MASSPTCEINFIFCLKLCLFPEKETCWCSAQCVQMKSFAKGLSSSSSWTLPHDSSLCVCVISKPFSKCLIASLKLHSCQVSCQFAKFLLNHELTLSRETFCLTSCHERLFTSTPLRTTNLSLNPGTKQEPIFRYQLQEKRMHFKYAVILSSIIQLTMLILVSFRIHETFWLLPLSR